MGFQTRYGGDQEHNIRSLIFSRAVALLFNWKYFWGWNLVWMTCRWCADDTTVRFWARFHWRMIYVIHMSSAHHPYVVWKRACRPHGMATALHKAYWLPCLLLKFVFSKNIGGHFSFLGPRITLFWISQWCLPCALSPTHDGISRFNSDVNTANLLAASMAVNPASQLFFQGKVWDQLWNWV